MFIPVTWLWPWFFSALSQDVYLWFELYRVCHHARPSNREAFGNASGIRGQSFLTSLGS